MVEPVDPKSNCSVTGLYFCDNQVVDGEKPFARGEIEITDINMLYLTQNQIYVEHFGRDYEMA